VAAESSGAEVAVLGCAAVAAVVIGSVWLGASAAALVTGHAGLGVGFGAAARAIPGLVSHPGAPAAAWRPPASSRIPGPVVFWVCTAPVLLLAVTAAAVAGSLVARRRSVGLERRERMGLNPEPRFARARDLAPLWVKGPTRDRVILGRVQGHLVATEDSRIDISDQLPWLLRRKAEQRRGARGAVVVMGPSQCGKTTALAVPAILEWDGPVIALSVKSDLLAATIASRRRRGEVKVFDPADATLEATSAWSPLRAAGTLSGAKKAARALANATDWSSGSGDMKFWVTGAEDLLAPLLFVAARQECGSMAYVVNWVLTMDRPDEEGENSQVAFMNGALCNHRDEAVARDAKAAADMLMGTWKLDFRQLSSVYVTAKAMITPWQDPIVAGSSKGTPIDLAWLLGDGVAEPPDAGKEADDVGKEADDAEDAGKTDDHGAKEARRSANTLYLCAPLHEAGRLAPVLGGLLGDLLEQSYERVGKSNEPIGPVLVVVDEAGNWPLSNLPGLASTCAGIGIQLILVYQSKAQIDAGYGRMADTIISNCLTKVFFAGLSDRSTLDYAEGLLGSEQVLSRQDSIDVGGGSGRRSVSHSTTRAELLPMALLRQVRPGEALLVHNTLPPAHLIGRYWFKDADLHLLATGEPIRPRGHRLASRLHQISGSRPGLTPKTAAADGNDTAKAGGKDAAKAGR
jgi:type IV secretion system protein VirD4